MDSAAFAAAFSAPVIFLGDHPLTLAEALLAGLAGLFCLLWRGARRAARAAGDRAGGLDS